MTAALAETPGDCVHGMVSAVLGLAALRVRFEWADLGDSAGYWRPENRTLQLDPGATIADAARLLRDFHDLCHGHGDGSWQTVRPHLRLVTPDERTAR